MCMTFFIATKHKIHFIAVFSIKQKWQDTICTFLGNLKHKICAPNSIPIQYRNTLTHKSHKIYFCNSIK